MSKEITIEIKAPCTGDGCERSLEKILCAPYLGPEVTVRAVEFVLESMEQMQNHDWAAVGPILCPDCFERDREERRRQPE